MVIVVCEGHEDAFLMEVGLEKYSACPFSLFVDSAWVALPTADVAFRQ